MLRALALPMRSPGVKQNYETCWIGWPGLYLRNEEQQVALKEALEAKVSKFLFLLNNLQNRYRESIRVHSKQPGGQGKQVSVLTDPLSAHAEKRGWKCIQ